MNFPLRRPWQRWALQDKQRKEREMKSPPQQTSLPLGTPEEVIGLTSWALASEQPPPMAGWYKTRSKDSPNLRQPQRRYWNGDHFSMPAHPDDHDSDEQRAREGKSWLLNDEIEWCGLLSPHPEMPHG